MPYTYADVLTEAREILQDVDTPTRYDDPTLINKLNRALLEISRVRPDAFWDQFDTDTDDIDVPRITAGTVTSVFVLPVQFFPAVVSFVVAWAEILDDEFTNDGRAAALLGQFRNQVMAL
jgi:hypothetical protein